MMDNSIYSINCTGDACVGDEVRFERAVFTGSYPNARFLHNEIVEGRIIRDSYDYSNSNLVEKLNK